MKMRLFPAFALLSAMLVGCGGGSGPDRSEPQEPVTNPDDDPVTGVISAPLDPSNGVLPFPINLLLSGSSHLTRNVPIDDPEDFGNPRVALSALDGFGTITPWTFRFSAAVDADTVVPASSVRVFEVQRARDTIAVADINGELVPGQDYVASMTASGGTTVVVDNPSVIQTH